METANQYVWEYGPLPACLAVPPDTVVMAGMCVRESYPQSAVAERLRDNDSCRELGVCAGAVVCHYMNIDKEY